MLKRSGLMFIDLAMWDILGKSLDTPVYQLLGGSYRDEIPLYANMWTERSWTTEETKFGLLSCIDLY